jgi:hypothetical protein
MICDRDVTGTTSTIEKREEKERSRGNERRDNR